jgi:hypothetical protein
MIRHAFSAWALGVCAACALSLPERPPVDRPAGGADAGATDPAATRARVAHRPGVGTVESASVVSLSSPSSASGGGTASAATSATMAYRVKMSDGTTQDLVQTGERFAVGERVQVTSEGRLIRR